jgi:1,4-alpha-glucan branching enzyme
MYTFKKFILLALCFSAKIVFAQAPLLDWTPGFLTEVQPGNVVITLNGAKGNGALNNYTPTNDIYVHTGVITTLSNSPSNWQHVVTTWGVNNASNATTYLGNSQWSFTIPGDLRTFYGITNPSEKIVKIAILFRNSPASGTVVARNSDASDMYIPVDTITGNLQMKFIQPPTEPRYIPWPEPISAIVGGTLPVQVVTNNNATISMNLNGAQFATNSSVTTLAGNPTILQACNNQITATANDGTSTVTQSINFFIQGGAAPVLALPSGVKDGINYHAGDTSATLVLYAPGKSSVILTGSFNNWSSNCSEVMNKTPDGLRWWKTINGLTPGALQKFQYLVDGSLFTTDPYSELILDPNNDGFISSTTYPNMPSYPVGRSGIVGTFQTGQTPYNWTATNYNRPDKRSLVVYELLLRDFSPRHSWTSLIDSLNYFKQLGINCIEVMPVNEFEGNESWGYNPDFFFAPDKYYGPAADMKKFVDEAHKLGIAVVMDAVFNQVTGQSPLAAMYWNSTTNKPTPNNPWLNEDAKHPFNVFNDFNHESAVTQYHCTRFMRHWMKNFHIDGFRWDLAKGFTQTNNPTDVGAWGNYDASRVAIWKRYYDSMQAIEPGSYCILEFLGSDQEESEYANYGMINWGKQTDEYQENSLGQTGNKSINRAYYINRPGYSKPGLISYAESHDEERAQFKNNNYGANNGGYNVKTLNTGLKRQEAMHACLLMVPGPKMIWQFGELGYDYSINTCADSVTINNNCRLANKPIRWDYYQVPERKAIYTAIGKMNKLRELKPKMFDSATVTTGSDLGNGFIKRIVLARPDYKIVTVANFDVVAQTFTQVFPANGKYYNFMSTDSISVSGGSKSLTLQPGEFKIYTSTNLNAGGSSGNVSIFDEKANHLFAASIYPNPSTGVSTLFVSVKTSSDCQVLLTDITGKAIRQINNWKLQAGDNDLKIETSSLNKGIYFVQIIANGMKQTIPLQVN